MMWSTLCPVSWENGSACRTNLPFTWLLILFLQNQNVIKIVLLFVHIKLRKTKNCFINTEKIKNHLWLSTNKADKNWIKELHCSHVASSRRLLFHSCGQTAVFSCFEGKPNEDGSWCYSSNWQDMKGALLQRKGTQGPEHDPAQTFQEVQQPQWKHGNKWIPIEHSDLASIANQSKRVREHCVSSPVGGTGNQFPAIQNKP